MATARNKRGDLRPVVATNLRRLRELFGLSQERLATALRQASALDWTQATVADLELGRRHLRVEELLVLGLFFRVGPEELLVPKSGQIRLSGRIAGDAGRVTDYLIARKGLKRAAYALLPVGEGIEGFSGVRIHAPVTRETRKEEADWRGIGGNVVELRHQRDLLWRGKLTPQQYAAWRRHRADRLRALQDR